VRQPPADAWFGRDKALPFAGSGGALAKKVDGQ
jgi:hypothetical protein